jgi:hypothetical protein
LADGTGVAFADETGVAFADGTGVAFADGTGVAFEDGVGEFLAETKGVTSLEAAGVFLLEATGVALAEAVGVLLTEEGLKLLKSFVVGLSSTELSSESSSMKIFLLGASGADRILSLSTGMGGLIVSKSNSVPLTVFGIISLGERGLSFLVFFFLASFFLIVVEDIHIYKLRQNFLYLSIVK